VAGARQTSRLHVKAPSKNDDRGRQGSLNTAWMGAAGLQELGSNTPYAQ